MKRALRLPMYVVRLNVTQETNMRFAYVGVLWVIPGGRETLIFRDFTLSLLLYRDYATAQTKLVRSHIFLGIKVI